MSLPDRIAAAAVRAVNLWGANNQLRMLSEECSEVSAEVNKFRRGRSSHEKFASEIADAWIMLQQARLILGGEIVDKAIEHKLARLEERITRAEAKGKV